MLIFRTRRAEILPLFPICYRLSPPTASFVLICQGANQLHGIGTLRTNRCSLRAGERPPKNFSRPLVTDPPRTRVSGRGDKLRA